ncbi:MAG TPA: hypothetical protein VN935_08195 [Rhizomicrobium sp.]|jgi:hypothetical protein|nr:hypothetical protein [Rhizomicrobium sp.]
MDSAAKLYHRAKEVRKIARGIFDETELRILLKFVRDSEKMAAETLSPKGVR